MNRLVITGEIIAMDALRFSPANTPLLNLKLSHQSEQLEAGIKRIVRCEIGVVVAGQLAVEAAKLKAGNKVKVQGFLERKSQNSAQLIIHGSKIETSS